ncbi:Type II secretion system protein L [Sphingomonas sp. EC-HK361]|uniref:type II secretion system protein GspL n=1 Tax=Sphingomonas sp. EC-HK361 TaxID=2038397 RepID=UPI001253FA0B|nr:type II secretion system protein GspL [Sphingomonas sp. EC-HK361]VVT02580.1 Type II secretion system protein L [Sphingomonas sp. EC-HK361]
MSDRLVLFLPPPDSPWRWLRVADGAVVARGEAMPEGDFGDVEIVAVAPADAVTLHWATLPDRSTAQAVAAARILAGDASAAPIDSLHVAVGREASEDRPIGVVATTRMREWLEAMARMALDPAAIIPAPMLLPRPEEGYVRADIGGQAVVRGATAGFADEDRVTALVTGDHAPATLDRDTVEAAIVAASELPALDLRQGPFARRRRIGIDWKLVRRLAVLAGAALLVTLAIDLVRIAKYSFGADAVEAEADSLARQGLPRGAVVNDANRELDTRLSALRGPGAGFGTTAAVVFSAVQAVAGAEVTALNFDTNGDLRVTLSAPGQAEANAVVQRIEQAGFTVRPSPFTSAGGRITGELTVALP